MSEEIPAGLCQCGCGNKTNLAARNRPSRGWIRGQPKRFLGHHRAHPSGPEAYRWKGGRNKTSGGWPTILMHDHPRADFNGYVREHVLLAEKALGKPLPPKAVVHHHTPTDLVICQDAAYHVLIHQRTRAYNACGNADFRKCHVCNKYDPIEKMVKQGRSNRYEHRQCMNTAKRAYRASVKARMRAQL